VSVEVAGRANLIGDHTDYQDGLALPFALAELTLKLEGHHRGDGVVLTSTLDGRSHALDPNRLAEGWGRYAAAVLRALADAGHALRPLEATISSSLPAGAGLASSAALELAVALAVCDEPLAPLELARVCQRAESVYVGVPCGLLDQLAIVAGVEGHALLLDCRDLTTAAVPWPEELTAAIVHSGVSRELADGAYALRRAETERAAALLELESLRVLAPADVPAALRMLPEPLGRRVRHVVSENARVEAVAAALRHGDRDPIAAALGESHRSLAEDFEASTPELDALVEILAALPGAIGARMTGGGFGGCAIALFEGSPAAAVLAGALELYAQRTGRSPRSWIGRPGTGIVRPG
jgi:galactokinase